MPSKRKPSTLSQVTRTVKKAAKTVAKKADKYVVEPVGHALGLSGKKPARKKAAGQKKPAKSKRTR